MLLWKSTPYSKTIKDLRARTEVLGGIFDYANKAERLEEVEHELAQGDVWNDPERAQALGKERSSLELVVKTIDNLSNGLSDAKDLPRYGG